MAELERVLDSFPVKNLGSIAYRVIDGQAVIVNLKKDTINTLNTIATRIWELTDGKTRVEEIIEKVCEGFEVSRDRVEKDCCQFMNQMVEKGLLILSSQPVEED